jgi:hypothetical protein
MNAGVSSSAIALKLIISLNVPFKVPSAEAPLSPMIRNTSVSSRIPSSSIASIKRADVIVGV